MLLAQPAPHQREIGNCAGDREIQELVDRHKASALLDHLIGDDHDSRRPADDQ